MINQKAENYLKSRDVLSKYACFIMPHCKSHSMVIFWIMYPCHTGYICLKKGSVDPENVQKRATQMAGIEGGPGAPFPKRKLGVCVCGGEEGF